MTFGNSHFALYFIWYGTGLQNLNGKLIFIFRQKRNQCSTLNALICKCLLDVNMFICNVWQILLLIYIYFCVLVFNVFLLFVLHQSILTQSTISVLYSNVYSAVSCLFTMLYVSYHRNWQNREKSFFNGNANIPTKVFIFKINPWKRRCKITMGIIIDIICMLPDSTRIFF